MRFRLTALALTLAVGLLASGEVFAEKDGKDTASGKKDEATFGSIKSPEAAEVQKAAEAWLADVKADAATVAKAKTVWASDRPLSDKVAATLALGDARVAKLLEAAKDADAAAPTELPAILKDVKAGSFLKANLALVYGKSLTLRKVYEEALDAFAAVKPEEVADPASFFFHKAVCEYELMLKDKADASIDRLLVDVTDSPERYRMVAALMRFDMLTWQEKDLGWIARKMDNIQRRLDLKRGGNQTQKQQKEVLVRLDEMIKELENKQKDGSGGGGGNGGQDVPSGGGQPGPDGPGTDKSSNPQRDTNGGTASGSGEVDSKKVKEIADVWGKLPEKDRPQAMRDLTRNMPAKDRAVIEAYLKELQKRSASK